MGVLEAICVSHKKGMVKREVPEAVFVENRGIEGDAHAGDWHRQVSLLMAESIVQVKEKIPTLRRGAFAENIITRGIDLGAIKVGERLVLNGDVVLEITQIGKECHNQGCAIKKATGDCIMPREGLFARVVTGGTIRPGCSVNLSKAKAVAEAVHNG